MKEEPVKIQKTSSVRSTVSNMKKITDIKSSLIFWFWTNFNVELLTGILLNFGNVLKLFDYKVLNLSILRSSPKIHNKKILFKLLFFATIPIIFYNLNIKNRAFIGIEKKYLAKLKNDSNSMKQKILDQSNIDAFYSVKIPLCSMVNSSIPEWWKIWIIRGILPSWGISTVLLDKVSIILINKNIENLRNFFEFYLYFIYGLSNGDGEWSNWRSEFNLCFERDEEQNSSHNLKKQKILLENDLLYSAMIGFCKKLLFEIEDPIDKDYESLFCFNPSYLKISIQRNHHTDSYYQYVTDYTEYLTNYGVKREYQEMGINLIQDFSDFYSWIYQCKNHSIFQGYEDSESDILRCIAEKKVVLSDRFAICNKNSIIAQNIISEILYNFSIFSLSIKPEFESANRFYYFIESDFKECDFTNLLILSKLPVITKILNTRIFISSITSFVVHKLQFFGKRNISKYLKGTELSTYRSISDSHSFKILNIFKSPNYTDLANLPINEWFFFYKSKIQSLNTQHFILFEDSKSSGINRIIDSDRVKSSSCFYSNYGNLVGYDYSSLKKFRRNILFLQKSICYLPKNIIHPLKSILKRTGQTFLFKVHSNFNFVEFLTEKMNQINFFIILPESTFDTIISNSVSVHEINLRNSVKYYSLIDVATIRSTSKDLLLLLKMSLFDIFGFDYGPKGNNRLFIIDILKQNKLISTYFAYIWNVYKYFHPITFKNIIVLKEELIDIRIRNINYLSKCTIEQVFSIWQKHLINRVFNEFTSQIDRFYSDMCGILNQIQYFDLFSKFRLYKMGDILKIFDLKEPKKERLLENKILEKQPYINYLFTGRVLEIILESFESFISYSVYLVNHFLNSRLFSCFNSNVKLLESMKFRLDKELVVSYCTKPINKTTLNFLHEENIPIKDFYHLICTVMANWTDCYNHFNIQNKIQLKSYFNKVNTLSLLDYFQNIVLNYDEKFFLCKKTIFEDSKGMDMDLLLTDASKKDNKFLLFAKKETLSLVESKYLIPLDKKDFLFLLNFSKRFMSLIWMESYNLEEISSFSLQLNLIKIFTIIKKIVKFGIYEYWRPFMELNHGEFFILEKNCYKNDFYKEEPRDGSVSTKLNSNDFNILKLLDSDGFSTSKKDLFHIINNKTGTKLSGQSLSNNLTKFLLSINLFNLYENIQLDKYSENWLLAKKYTLWFFTPEWWKYIQKLFSETFSEILLNVFDHFEYNVFESLTNIKKSLIYQCFNFLENLRCSIFKSPIINYDNYLSRDIIGQERFSLWFLVDSITGHSSVLYLILILIFYVVFPQYLATLLGFHYFSLWKRYEIIKYLEDYPWKISRSAKYFFSLIIQGSVRISLINFFNKFLKQLTCFNFFDPFGRYISFWLSRKKNVDFYREDKSFVVQYLVTNTTLSHNEVQLNNDFDPLYNSVNKSIGKQGFTYFQFNAKDFKKDSFTYKNLPFDLFENTLLAALKYNLNSTIIPGRFHLWSNTPISIQSRSFSKGILLIGSTETGRSYLVKNLAVNYCFPLVQIPIKRFLFNIKKSDFHNTSMGFFSRKCLQRLNLTFELVKKISPCIVWIHDIHYLNFDFDYTIKELGVNSRFILHSLLRHLSSRNSNNCIEKNIIIAPTHIPTRVDPSFISPDRLDQLLNIRIFNPHKRLKEFISFLRIRGFHLEIIDSVGYDGFSLITTGYSKRDLVVLANETLLIGIRQKISSLGVDIIESAFYRQSWTIDNKFKSKTGYGILLYIIGRTITRNLFTKNTCLDFPLINQNFLRKRFYFISDWYIETPIVESTMKESTMLPYIFGCLAGLAARDSWFTREKKQEDFVPLAPIADNDFQLACGIMESFLEEFPRLNLHENDLMQNVFLFSNPKIFYITVKRLIYHNLNRSIENNELSFSTNVFFGGVPPLNLYRTPRLWRISFLRSSIYEFVRVPSELDLSNESIISHQNQNNLIQSHSVLAKFECEQNERFEIGEKSFVGYRRLLMDVRKKHRKTMINKNNILPRFFVELGTDELCTQQNTQYSFYNKSNKYVGGRFVWDPTSSLLFENDSFFSHDELFSGEQTVRNLYITYSMNRTKHNSFTIDKYRKFLHHDSNQNQDSMSKVFTGPCNELPRREKRDFENVKRNQILKSHLLIPQLFPIVYPYQIMFMDEIQNTHDHFDLSDQRHRWIKVNRSSLRDSIIYTTLFEIYHYLFNGFSANRKSLVRIISKLSKNGFILSSEFEEIFSDWV